MYAVIETGGKQYRVQPGDIVQVEKLPGEVGASLKFDRVLFAAKAEGESSKIWLGKPLLNGATVAAEVVGQGRGDKILIVKMKRRKQYRRTKGHRQDYTQVLVTTVDNGAGENATLADADRKSVLTKFQCHLMPRGGKPVAAAAGGPKKAATKKSAQEMKAPAASPAAPRTEKKAAAAKKPAAKKS